MIPYIFKANGTISLMIDGSMKPIDTTHKNYEKIKEALKAQDWDSIPKLVNISEQVEEAIKASSIEDDEVTIKDGEVLYNGNPIHNTLTDRIVSMASDGFDIGYMVAFLKNLMANPSHRAVNELYDFLEAGNIPITENGTFLTYKKIREDWKDIYTGKIDNSIGAYVSMPRNLVDDNSYQTCSVGLHVCSYDYLPHFGSSKGSRVVICEVNPKDVVSIPKDYSNSKMRCCAYKVIGEVTDYSDNDILAERPVIDIDSLGIQNDDVTEHSSITAKQIGKMIRAQLENNIITVSQLASIIFQAGGTDEEADRIFNMVKAGQFKKAGKTISRWIKSDRVNGDTIIDLIHIDTSSNDPQDVDYSCCL